MRDWKNIVASINSYFKTEWKSETVIEYPGVDFDPSTSDMLEWVQPAIQQENSMPQRRGGNLEKIVIVIWIYHKFGENYLRCAELGNLAREIFNQQDIDLLIVGKTIRCRESEYFYYGSESNQRGELEGMETAAVRTIAMVE